MAQISLHHVRLKMSEPAQVVRILECPIKFGPVDLPLLILIPHMYGPQGPVEARQDRPNS